MNNERSVRNPMNYSGIQNVNSCLTSGKSVAASERADREEAGHVEMTPCASGPDADGQSAGGRRADGKGPAGQGAYGRGAGVLLPVFSLPDPYGIGCFSKGAYDFIDCLAASGMQYWQILPLHPAGAADSPYQPLSCFAGDPVYISIEGLIADGLLSRDEALEIRASFLRKAGISQFPEDEVLYPYVRPMKEQLCRLSWERFQNLEAAFFTEISTGRFADDAAMNPAQQGGHLSPAGFARFAMEERDWLQDAAFYLALQHENKGTSYLTWAPALFSRDPDTLREAADRLEPEISYQSWLQYVFQMQWNSILSYAHQKGIRIIGDLPIYASPESAELFAHPDCFLLGPDRRPCEVAGCPPDDFAPAGQVWGNPLYDWDAMKADGYAWWKARLRRCFALCDLVRLDHARGLAGYYAIPAETMDACDGHWEPGPGLPFLREMTALFGKARFIAEDLGTITPDVIEMIDQSGLPGMKVLQFAFDGNPDNPYLPHRLSVNSVLYTGTHDNNTTRAWYAALPDDQKRRISAYIRSAGSTGEASDRMPGNAPAYGASAAARALIEIACQSASKLCILPMADLLLLGPEGRINTPGTTCHNWVWRMPENAFSKELCQYLNRLARLSGRTEAARPVITQAEENRTITGRSRFGSPADDFPAKKPPLQETGGPRGGMEEKAPVRLPHAAVAGALSVDICPDFGPRRAGYRNADTKTVTDAKASCAEDRFPTADSCKTDIDFGTLIRPGEITHIEGNEIHPGGPVANTGMAFSIFGVQPRFLAKIGDDAFGHMLKEMLTAASGTDGSASLTADPETYTAYSIILAPPGLDRAILQNPGANDHFRASDIPWDSLQDCRLFHFGHPSTMRYMYENDGDELVRIFQKARDLRMVTSLDLCAIDPRSDAAQADWQRILKRVLPLVDFFVPSYGELREILYPRQDFSAIKETQNHIFGPAQGDWPGDFAGSAPGLAPTPLELAAKAREWGSSTVLIKCGDRGMAYDNGDRKFFKDVEKRLGLFCGQLSDWAGQRGMAPAVPVEHVVSGLGAGDTSIAAYLAALMQGFPFPKALQIALTEGALCVTSASAVGGLVPFASLS